jgi:hypothetical protein
VSGFFHIFVANLTDMDITKLDRSKFLFDPLDPNLFTKLSKHKEFTKPIEHIDKLKLCQYIVLMYDMNNDEVRDALPYYPQRKYEVARAVGLTPDKMVPKKIENMMIGKNKNINEMIVRYLTLFNNPDLLMLAAYYQIYIGLNKQAFSGEFSKDTITSLDKVNETIRELTERVYGGKDETELRAELYRSIEDQSLGLRPEEVAKKIKERKPLFDDGFSPYQSDYLPENIKFLGDS